MSNVNTDNISDAALCEIAANGVATITLNRP
ncbi:MAG: enoyl-CoA hydratase/isomerase family protein, partial [Thalassospira sp.]|nr:enoyl-CoA hydratase/isomerase family protein [Thalassospira sp.]